MTSEADIDITAEEYRVDVEREEREEELAVERSKRVACEHELTVMRELRDNASRAIIELEKELQALRLERTALNLECQYAATRVVEAEKKAATYDKRNLELESRLEWQTLLAASGVTMHMGDALTELERIRIMQAPDSEMRRAVDALVHSLIEQGRMLDKVGRIFGVDTRKMRSVLELEEAIDGQLEQHGISVIVSDETFGVTISSIKLPTTAGEMQRVCEEAGGASFVDQYVDAMRPVFDSLLRATVLAIATKLEVKP